MNRPVLFRVDNSETMGIGHLMRCLSLADGLKLSGFESVFLCYPHERALNYIIKDRDHTLIELNSRQDLEQNTSYESWLGCTQKEDAIECLSIISSYDDPIVIVDHYALDHIWESTIKETSQCMVVIDDLANRKHDCDMLIDTTFNRLDSEYSKLVNQKTNVLAGTEYCLLKREFLTLRSDARQKRQNTRSINNILVNFGGTDPYRHASMVLGNLRNINYQGEIKVVISSACNWLEDLRIEAAIMPNVELLVDVNNMPELMLKADLAFGAMGSTTWERCFLGLPSICIQAVENQSEIAKRLQITGAIILVQPSDILDLILSKVTANTDLTWWHELAQNSFAICDGKGVERVINEIQAAVS